MMAAEYGHDSMVTTLITHRLGLWVPVWHRSLSVLQRERDRSDPGAFPHSGGEPLKPLWKGGVSLLLDHSGADLNRADQHGLQLSVWVGSLVCFGDVGTCRGQLGGHRGQCLTGPL